MTNETAAYKVKSISSTSAWQQYRQLYFGDAPLHKAIQTECVTSAFGLLPGALGLGLRKILYPSLFQKAGKGVIFGRNLTLRHAHKISIDDKTILDDGVVLDAKGNTNRGITIGKNVYIGRNTMIYTKNGNIHIDDHANISSNCQIFSSGDLYIGAGTMIAAFCYVLNGGIYDSSPDALPFAEQPGNISKGPTRIGKNCWIAAHCTITDGVALGEHCVVGAGSVVMQSFPDQTFCAGTPARAISRK